MKVSYKCVSLVHIIPNMLQREEVMMKNPNLIIFVGFKVITAIIILGILL
jgi:hypothetical protein